MKKIPVSSSNPIRLFFSYAHEDEKLRDKLADHLMGLQKDGLIAAWHDRKITAGSDWEGEIKENLETADIILLLISSDFFASRYCWDVEFKTALEKYENQSARVIPVILRPMDWQIEILRGLQALPTDALAVTSWPNEDEAFVDIVKGIRRVVEELTQVEVIEETSTTAIATNPFGDRGKITNPEKFFGREFLLQEIFTELKKGGSISLVGESQVGKSSIISQICQQGIEKLSLAQDNFVYLDMQLIGSDEEFFEELCYELNIEPSRRRRLTRQLQGKQYILCLDQIEKLKDESNFTKDARTELRGLADGADMPLTLVIASRSPLNQLFPESSDQTSPLYNLCRRMTIDSFDLNTTKRFIQSRLRGTGIQFSEEQIQQLWEISRGNPGKLQAEAQNLYEKLRATLK